ncbi:MAG: AAA family ATPase [Cypionkella sp.]
METTWTRCLDVGTSVVLDFGFWSRAERERTRSLVAAHGAATVLYRLNCDEELALRRIDERNKQLVGSLHIAPNTFQLLRARFEPLGPDEDRVEVDSVSG